MKRILRTLLTKASTENITMAFALLLLLPSIASASCLSNDQVIFLGNLETQLNITDHKLISSFESVCEENRTAQYATVEQLENRISVALAIISNEDIELRVDERMKNYTDWFNEEISIVKLFEAIYNNTTSQRGDYATKEDFSQLKADMLTLQDRMSQQNQLQPVQQGPDYVLIIGGIIAFAILIYIFKSRRYGLKDLPLMGSQSPATKYLPPDETGISEERVKVMQELAHKLAKTKADIHEK